MSSHIGERNQVVEFNLNDQRTSIVVTYFEEFYHEILSLKYLVLNKPWNKKEKAETSTPKATAEYILSKLQEKIESLSLLVSQQGSSFVESFYNDAQFVMVALADEVFLNIDWPGKLFWEKNLLEQRVYNTHSAGQVFYDKLEKLLEKNDAAHTDVAIVFLNALGLGFRGKYRGFNNDEGILVSYRTRLFTLINRVSPYLFKNKVQLFPEVYSYTLEGGKPKELPNIKNWYMIFLAIGLIYLLASYIIWFGNTSEISSIVNNIVSYAVYVN